MKSRTTMSLPILSQFKVLERGEIGGKVCRLLAAEPVALYDSPLADSRIVRKLQPGSLVVAFDDPGEKRQIATGDQSFGYIDRALTLLPIQGVEPLTIYDAEKRTAVESGLPSLETSRADYAAEQRRMKRSQYWFVFGFFLVAVLGTLAVLVHISPAPLQ